MSYCWQIQQRAGQPTTDGVGPVTRPPPAVPVDPAPGDCDPRTAIRQQAQLPGKAVALGPPFAIGACLAIALSNNLQIGTLGASGTFQMFFSFGSASALSDRRYECDEVLESLESGINGSSGGPCRFPANA